jgi:hypothetical protein
MSSYMEKKAPAVPINTLFREGSERVCGGRLHRQSQTVWYATATAVFPTQLYSPYGLLRQTFAVPSERDFVVTDR